MVDVVNLTEKLSRFTEHWSPKIVGEVNDMHVKLVKFAGEFVWHHHEREDELFFVVAGRLRMLLRDGDRDVGPGEFIVIPHGVEHCPRPSPTRSTSCCSSPRPRSTPATS